MIMPRDKVSKSVAVDGRATRPQCCPDLINRALDPDDAYDIHHLQPGVAADRDGHARTLQSDDLDLVGARQRAPFLARLLQNLFVRDQDLRLVEREIEGHTIGDFGADQAHFFRHCLAAPAQRNHVAHPQLLIVCGPERHAIANEIGRPVLGIVPQDVV